MSERSKEDWGRVAVSLPGWGLAIGMVGFVNGQRCVVIGRDDWPEEDRHGPWMTMPCSGEWDDCPAMCSDMARSTRVDEFAPDVDDPATAGCLRALLGPGVAVRHDTDRGDDPNAHTAYLPGCGRGDGSTPGRAIVALAEQLGQWPGGDPDTLPELWMTPEGPMSGREKLVSMATFITSEGGDGAAWLALCERVS